MPGGTAIHGGQPVEYVEETSWATVEADAAWKWFGLIDSASVTEGVEQETLRYNPSDANKANALESLDNIKTGEMFEFEVTYYPQTLDLFEYFMGGAGSLSDSLTALNIGMQNSDAGTNEYNVLTGVVGEEITLTIAEDSAAEIDASFIAADADGWSSTDYIGTGSHATENSNDALQFTDLSNVNYGGSALGDYIEELTLTVSNDLAVLKDFNAAPASNIAAIQPLTREITVELGLTYDDMSLASDVRSYTENDLTFTFGPSSENWTVNDVQFPEFPYEFGPEDLLGDSVSSDPCTGLSYA